MGQMQPHAITTKDVTTNYLSFRNRLLWQFLIFFLIQFTAARRMNEILKICTRKQQFSDAGTVRVAVPVFLLCTSYSCTPAERTALVFLKTQDILQTQDCFIHLYESSCLFSGQAPTAHRLERTALRAHIQMRQPLQLDIIKNHSVDLLSYQTCSEQNQSHSQ